MYARLAAVWIALYILTGFRPISAQVHDPLNLTPIINAFRFDGVATTVRWDACGVVNAYYLPWKRQVVLCEELKVLSPGAFRYVLAHELAHGVIMQRNVAFTGSHEWAADELAGLILILIGHEQDVLDGAAFWAGMSRDEDPYDDHYGDRRRAHNLQCLVWTRNRDPFIRMMCNTDYTHVVSAWVRLLGMDTE